MYLLDIRMRCHQNHESLLPMVMDLSRRIPGEYTVDNLLNPHHELCSRGERRHLGTDQMDYYLN
jgi:hypothetical protein